MPDKRALHANITTDADSGWRRFTEAVGVSKGAVAEVLGRAWNALTDDDLAAAADTGSVGEFDGPGFVRECRKVDAQNRRRG